MLVGRKRTRLKPVGSWTERSRKMKRPRAMSMRAPDEMDAENENARELLAGERRTQISLSHN